MNGQTGVQMNGQMDTQMHVWIARWIYRYIDEWMDGVIHGWMDGQRWMNGQRPAWVDEWIGGYTELWMGAWMDGWINLGMEQQGLPLEVEATVPATLIFSTHFQTSESKLNTQFVNISKILGFSVMLHLATNDIRVYSEFSIEGIQGRRCGRARKAGEV